MLPKSMFQDFLHHKISKVGFNFIIIKTKNGLDKVMKKIQK